MRLVVVGNGMAGVRAIEEILARGGGEKFDITVFGDEPYGNYNRILLSNVLAGKDDPREIYLNALDWYTDNGIDLRAGVRVVRLDTFAHLVHADDGTTMRYDKLVLATGSRAFFPPMDGLWADDKTLADGVPVVIENIGGAGGAIGAQKVASAAPDGYTLLVGASNEIAINKLVTKKVKYDIKDFTAIGLIASQPLVLVAST